MIDIVEAIASEAGALALRYFRNEAALNVEAKGPLDLVTAADRAVERLIVDRLTAAFPDDGIVGEEGATAPSRSGRFWVIDPVDGTFNFVRGSDQWSVSIGLFDGIRPVLGALSLPAQNALVIGGEGVTPRINGAQIRPLQPLNPMRPAAALGFGSASTDQRSATLVREVGNAGMVFRYCGCGSVSLLSVALGQVDGYLSLAESSWDVMAALAIIAPLGGVDTLDWAALGLKQKFPLVCGSPEFLELVAPFAARALS